MNIAVCGSSNPSGDGYDIAVKTGIRIAENGAVLLCGGMGGVMEGAAKGAHSKGGITVGIMPGYDKGEANPYITIPVITGMADARNVVLVRSADLVVAIEGGYGTLSEIAIALKIGKPVVGINTWSNINGVDSAADVDSLLSKIDSFIRTHR